MPDESTPPPKPTIPRKPMTKTPWRVKVTPAWGIMLVAPEEQEPDAFGDGTHDAVVAFRLRSRSDAEAMGLGPSAQRLLAALKGLMAADDRETRTAGQQLAWDEARDAVKAAEEAMQ